MENDVILKNGKPMSSDETLIELIKMSDALNFISKWELPRATLSNGQECSYESALGSNGVQKYIREIAEKGLSK